MDYGFFPVKSHNCHARVKASQHSERKLTLRESTRIGVLL